MATHTVHYDVTLSYTEEEEETTGMSNFIGNLYASLKKANFKIFKEHHHGQNPKGEEKMMISKTLKKGIQGSRCAVIIFSKNYATSTRCLEEVALMMECRNELGQRVFPVFLMGVEGSDVRHQKGSFEEPFRKHEQCFDQKVVEKWRSALKLAGGLVGLNLKGIPDGDEEKLITKIVEDVSNVLRDQIPPPNAVEEMQTEPIADSWMKIFHNAKAVRLRSHHEKYLTADDEDKELVLQRTNGESWNATWTVEFLEDPNWIRLKSCYGTYLTASDIPFLLGMTGGKVLQTQKLDSSVEWELIREGFQVKLKTRHCNYLRANGGPPPWRNSITHDHDMPNSINPTKCWFLWNLDIVR